MASKRARRRHDRGHDEDHEEHMDERWLVSFADMMTLMFALFMVLFSISSVNTSKFEALQRAMQDAFSGAVMSGGQRVMESGSTSASEQAAPAAPMPAVMPLEALNDVRPELERSDADAAAREDEDFRRLKARLDQLIANANLQSKVSAEIRRRGLVIRLLTDDVFFASGEARLKPEALPLLGQIGRLIRDERRHPVVVEGYTDSQPIATGHFPSNWELSGARAAAVVRQFAAAGIHAQRMSLSGYAQQHPIDTNSTAAGRARNRRVEVVLARLKS